MSALVAVLVGGGGTLFAILVLVWAWMRGGVGRWGALLVFAAGSALAVAGAVWSVVLAAVIAGGDVLDAMLRAVSGIG